MLARGWQQADFILITGDSYVDHPSFGIAIISRVLEKAGFKVVILAQPQKNEDYTRFGEPRYAFLVTGGNIDSMVNHYTAAKRKRSEDIYTAGNKAGQRPDYALCAYTKKVKELYPHIPAVLGGLEASFRRFAYYDYWSDSVKPSVLFESEGDILVYGMAELAVLDVADKLKSGMAVSAMRGIRGTCILGGTQDIPKGAVSCASFKKVASDKESYLKSYKLQHENQDHFYGKAVVQQHEDRYLIQNPPMRPLTREELDDVFALPYMKDYHPSYEKLGGVRALDEVEFSIMQNRGCFGDCNFCSITFHQGRSVVSRSKQSIVAEARAMAGSKRFKGYIHDVGGPTANFRGPSCQKQLKAGMCKNKKCLAPGPCANLMADHSEYLDILAELRKLPRVKKVFIRSGIRYDYVNYDKNKDFLNTLIEHHVSGQLKIAPEHSSPAVLKRMGKPSINEFIKFKEDFYRTTKRLKKEQYLVPYLMSSHPGSTLTDAIDLALFLKKHNIRPEQVQDFYPTPGTASTTMFYTGIDPFNMEKVYIPRSQKEKDMQRALLQYYNPKNRPVIRQALMQAKRGDLIGSGPHCLIPQSRSNVHGKK